VLEVLHLLWMVLNLKGTDNALIMEDCVQLDEMDTIPDKRKR